MREGKNKKKYNKKNMRKMKVKWTPDLEQDLDTMTTKGSIMYDEEFTNKIIEEFGSVENYKKSDEFIKLKSEFETILNEL